MRDGLPETTDGHLGHVDAGDGPQIRVCGPGGRGEASLAPTTTIDCVLVGTEQPAFFLPIWSPKQTLEQLPLNTTVFENEISLARLFTYDSYKTLYHTVLRLFCWSNF